MTLTAAERARRRKEWQLRSDSNGGRPLTVDPAVVARLIERQMAAHRLNLNALSGASGVPLAALSNIRRARVKYVRRSTVVALRTLPHLTRTARVPAGGTMVRLGALSALGYSVKDLSAHFGREVAPYGRAEVTFRIAVDVIDALLALERTPGPHPFAAKHAAKKGHLTPDRYDRDCLTDPSWDGTGGVLGGVTGAELAAEIHFLTGQGATRAEIAGQLGVGEPWVRDVQAHAVTADRAA